MNTLTFTREDIIRRTSKKLNLSHNDMKLALDAVLETMREMITEEQSNIRIELRNFGVFEVKPTKAKPRARNPRTNEEVYVPPRRKVQFRPGKVIRKVLQKESGFRVFFNIDFSAARSFLYMDFSNPARSAQSSLYRLPGAVESAQSFFI